MLCSKHRYFVAIGTELWITLSSDFKTGMDSFLLSLFSHLHIMDVRVISDHARTWTLDIVRMISHANLVSFFSLFFLFCYFLSVGENVGKSMTESECKYFHNLQGAVQVTPRFATTGSKKKNCISFWRQNTIVFFAHPFQQKTPLQISKSGKHRQGNIHTDKTKTLPFLSQPSSEANIASITETSHPCLLRPTDRVCLHNSAFSSPSSGY